ncbi:uncharacterized protein LOC110442035 [Mizuhopecten yessoensis]|uniref:uncharacterized protein LOC110442035 n=1 Tax=Mizuhopecten yessoensis TaxID=6573 RepID=UPI000B45BEF7|nr:uncharacterized protein LOC110442035 [Mizuhopecten yessoensis]
MELAGELQIHIKQEPLEDFGCEQFGKTCTEQLSCSSDPLSEISSRPESERGEKRKESLDGITETISEKRKRYNVTEASDVEIFADDYVTGTPRDGQHSDRSNSEGSKILGKLGKFQCLLCDDAFDTENELMIHLSLVHKHVPSNRRQSSRFARHTCQVCFARFRTLKDFFNHTSCHNSHPGLATVDRDLSTRVSNSLSKNALHSYFLNAASGFSSRDLMQPSFKCDCCSTVFGNRDSYAMHVMMRVKNESCKLLNGGESSAEMNMLNSGTGTTNGDHSKSPVSITGSPEEHGRVKIDTSSPPGLHQAYYIDVTSHAEKDEYLQSVLAKNNNNTNHSEPFGIDNIRAAIKEGRKCVVCEQIFDDQDSLAMHVMSRHSDGMTSSQPAVSSAQYNKTPSPPSSSRVMKYFSPYAHDRLLTLQTEVLYCDHCGQSFVNRDALAMHVLTHMRDHETSVSQSASSVTEAMRLNSRIQETLDNARFRRHHESSIRTSLDIDTNEPLDLAAKKTISFGSTSSGKENNGPLDLNVSIDLRTPRVDPQTDKREKENDTQFTEPQFQLPPKSDETLRQVHGNHARNNVTTEGVYQLPEGQHEPGWTRSASAPSVNCQEFPGTSERAASTGCLPSASQMAGIPTDFIFAAQEPCRPQETTREERKSNEGQNSKVSESLNQGQLSDPTLTTRKTLHGKDSLEGLLGFKTPEIVASGSASQLVGCPYMASDGKEPNIMSALMKNKDLHMCKYCEIIFPNRTLYYLHMGLHNVNTPWQCNMCGKVCGNVHDFNAHIIHL